MSILSATSDQIINGVTSFLTVHPDIIYANILTRLNGPTLAFLASVSPELHALSADENLWQTIATTRWPSIKDRRIRNVISTFPAGYRSFFADAHSFLDHKPSKHIPPQKSITEKLISSVDLYYGDDVIHSTVKEIETVSPEFLSSNFRLDLIEPEDPIGIKFRQFENAETWIQHVEETLKLSWILVDPKRKRVINVSSRDPVYSKQHCLEEGDVRLEFTTVVGGDGVGGSSSEFVMCGVYVTCGMNEEGDVHVRELSIHVEDMERRILKGEDSLVILNGAMRKGERRKGGNWEERKERYVEIMEKKEKRKEKLQ